MTSGDVFECGYQLVVGLGFFGRGVWGRLVCNDESAAVTQIVRVLWVV